MLCSILSTLFHIVTHLCCLGGPLHGSGAALLIHTVTVLSYRYALVLRRHGSTEAMTSNIEASFAGTSLWADRKETRRVFMFAGAIHVKR
ncbi:hypothetical protein DER44DRAFT_540007 [Fusarium oxysporum]|nr:hypothetical protein DER44DRAFT_540007 [Fusarium oxysporum]